MQLVGQMPQIVVAKSALPEPTRIRCHDLAKTRKPSLPLLGERAGVRAGSLDTNIPVFGLAGRAGIKPNFSNIPPFPKILSGPTSHARASFAKMKLGGGEAHVALAARPAIQWL